MTGFNPRDTPGIYYVTRDGVTTMQLDRWLADSPYAQEFPRPERDICAALLRFCLDRIEHLDVSEEAS